MKVTHVLWLAGVSWDGIPGADKQMVSCLTRHVPVFYVDPPLSPATPARFRGGLRRPVRPRLQVIDGRLTRLSPVVLPGLSRPGVRATTAPVVRRQVKRALARQGVRPDVVVSTSLADMLGHWGADVLNVLYGTDNYVGGAQLMGLSARHVRKQERRALGKADKVVCVTPPLAARWAGLGASPQVVLPGCVLTDTARHAPAPGLANLPRPVVGLIGQLSDRLDLAALESVADAGFTLLIVGPVDPRWASARFAALTARPNVRVTGPVPPAEVPSYLAAIDIGITPYRDTPFNRTAYPLKTMEYLGAGVPAVTTPMDTARWLHADLAAAAGEPAASQILALAPEGRGFAAVVRRVADEVTPELASIAVKFASRHTWEPRAAEFAAAIGVEPR
jgi:teichuronic acid biosynthesis glycosyltransferase TuaH